VKKGSKFDSDKYTPEMWEKGGATVVQPKSGSAYTVWPVIHAELRRRKLKSVDAAGALRLQESGKAVLVDCRPEYQFRRQRIAGAISAPLFREVVGTGLWDNVKRAVMAVGLAMTATERNPDFIADTKAALASAGVRRGTKLIVYCGLGGTIEVGVKPWAPDRTKEFKDDPERMFGRESRSLKACHDLLVEGGWRDGEVLHLEGGIGQWRYDGFPLESD
jgi:rhodanese-related sulfurtransferase